MGGSQSIINYADILENPDANLGESQIYVNPDKRDVGDCNTSYWNLFAENAKGEFANENCLGHRPINAEGEAGDYSWLSYSEVYDLTIRIGHQITQRKLASTNEAGSRPMKFFGIYGKTSIEWLYMMLACASQNVTLAPFYDTLGPEVVEYILKHTDLETVAVDSDKAQGLIDLKKKGSSGHLKTVILMDKDDEDIKKAAIDAGLECYHYSDLMESDGTPEEIKSDPEDIFLVSYTSGTTGTPKAALLCHKGCVTATKMMLHYAPFYPGDSLIVYLPMAHIYGQYTFWGTLFSGAAGGLWQGNPLKLKEDLAELKPSLFPSVPRLYQRFYDLIQSKFRDATGLKKSLIDRAVASKLHYLKTTGSVEHRIYDALVFNKIKSIFGGNLRRMATSAAPIDPEVLNFLKICFCCPILEAYGQTETGVSCVTHFEDPVTGHVGGPAPGVELKLVDVKEMDYTSKDVNEDGDPTPRGEICFRADCAFIEYYKDAEKTADTRDGKGWVYTGDIGVIEARNQLRIIDRKKNIFKLAHGEYVAPEKIENIYVQSPFIQQIWVHGDSLESTLVAIVIPDPIYTQKYAEETLGLAGSIEELCKNADLVKAIFDDLTSIGKARGLRGFEAVKKITLDVEPFSIENGLITPTFKIKRHEMKKQYAAEIKTMYGQ